MILYLLLSYLLGSLLFAVIIGKIKNVNLQHENSGNLGARNAGRTLGKWAFVVVAVGDALNGLLVVVIGRALEFSEPVIALAVIAVTLGHLYPFWNKGRGGKGVATIVGALLAFSPLYILVLLASFLVSMLVTKSATLSMVSSFVVYGVVMAIAVPAGIILCVALILVLWKQRNSIMERVRPHVLE